MSPANGMSGWVGPAPAYQVGPLSAMATGLELGSFVDN